MIEGSVIDDDSICHKFFENIYFNDLKRLNNYRKPRITKKKLLFCTHLFKKIVKLAVLA